MYIYSLPASTCSRYWGYVSEQKKIPYLLEGNKLIRKLDNRLESDKPYGEKQSRAEEEGSKGWSKDWEAGTVLTSVVRIGSSASLIWVYERNAETLCLSKK